MEQLWAPWRMDLIEKGEPKGGCIFCELPKMQNDRENLVLGRTARPFRARERRQLAALARIAASRVRASV